MIAGQPTTYWDRNRRRVYWTVGAVLAYTVIGFLILPPIVRWVAVKQLSKLMDRPVSIAKLRLNPYALSATVRGFLIRDKDGEPFVSWDEVYVNFQLSSLFGKAWTFREVRTSQPYVRVQMNQDYTLNFSDLIEKFSKSDPTKPNPSTPSKPLSLRVDLLNIAGARASFADLTTRTPFRRIVGPLQITLTHFRTDPENRNPYAFSGTTDMGERFSWSGHFFLEPIRSHGEFSLENLAISKYAPLYQDLVKFDVEDGIVTVRSTYNLEKSPTVNHVAVTNTSVTVRGLKVKDRVSGEPVASLAEFDLTGASLDVSARRAEVQSIGIKGGQLQVKRNKEAAINLVQLSEPAPSGTNVSGGVILLLQSVTNAFAMLLNSTNHWQGTIRDIRISDCGVQLEDLVNSRPVHLRMDDINLAVKNVSNLPGAELSAQLSLRWNTNGTIKTDIAAHLSPAHAEVGLKLEQLELKPLDPYLEPFVDVLILRSRLGLDAKFLLSQANDELPKVSFRGDLRLDDMGAAEANTGADLVRWKSLRFSGIEAHLDPPTFSAAELGVEDLFAHVIVETNGTLNVLAAARMTATNTNSLATAAPARETRSAKKPKSKPALAASTNAVQIGFPIKLAISSVVFTNGQVRFTDRSMIPNVDVSIRQLSGAIQRVTSDPADQAQLDVFGRVENTGPVHVTGKVHPFFKEKATDLKIVVGDVDLNPTGPYCGKYLGYRLTKGRLGLDLTYEVRDGRVKGENLIKLDQFTLGEKVPSPDAMSLPIKLGIAILKDRNGLIELDVPVEGNLTDPEFRLGKVITRAVVNVLTKIVTSPFAALGAVFGGGGEELSQQEFAPGVFTLQPAGREKLDRLIKGLEERPGLQLEIEGAVDPSLDGRALRRQKLEAEYRLAKWQALGRSARAETSPEKISVTPEEFTRVVEKRYAREFSAEAVAARTGPTNAVAGTNLAGVGPAGRPRVSSSSATGPVKGAVALRTEAGERAPKVAPESMEDQVLSLIPLTETDYVQLATERAKQVRDYVLRSGRVTSDRILLSDPMAVAKAAKGTKVYLKLQ